MSAERHFKFTEVNVERAPPPMTERVTYWDSLLPGLGLRVSPPHPRSGFVRRTFIAMYRVDGKLVQETIGSTILFPNLEEVRELARESMRKAQKGVNAALERRMEKLNRRAARHPLSGATVKDTTNLLPAVVSRFMIQYKNGEGGKTRRQRTISAIEHNLNRLASWQPYTILNGVSINVGKIWSIVDINKITREEIKDYHKKMGDNGNKIAANSSLRSVKSLFFWAHEEKIILANPIADLKILYGQTSRDRWLKDQEIRAFWFCCDELGYPYGPMYRLLLLKACRRNEVAHIPAHGEVEIRKRLWSIPKERTKSKRDFLVPLVDMAVDIIENLPKFSGNDYMFTGAYGGVAQQFNDSKTRLDQFMTAHLRREGHLGPDEPLEPWTLHDLRRTARTNFSRLKIDDNIGERLLNHAIPGVRGVYDRWAYLDEKREALEKWSDLIKTIIS